MRERGVFLLLLVQDAVMHLANEGGGFAARWWWWYNLSGPRRREKIK